MRLAELIQQLPFDDVWDRFLAAYPEEVGNAPKYHRVYRLLQQLDPVTPDFAVWVHREADEDGPYVVVSGVKPGEDCLYAIEFSPWNEWLGAELTSPPLDRFTPADLVAHALWELTFVGFTPASGQKFIDQVKDEMERELKDEDEDDGKAA